MTSPTDLDRPQPDIRASDADRSAVGDRLAAHAAAGRLSVDELEQRLAAAHGAVHRRELAALEADLPSLEPRGAQRAPAPVRAPALGLAIALVVLAVALSVAVGHPVFVPLLVAFFLLRPANRHRRAGVLPARSVS